MLFHVCISFKVVWFTHKNFRLFCRPTLHKYGMMGHQVQITPGRDTFELSVAVTGPYNADFGKSFSFVGNGTNVY